MFKAEGSKIGLDLNVSKCESISRSHDHREQAFQGFLENAPEDACLLGASLCTGRALDKALSSRCSDLRIAIGRLKVLPSHDALILLRSSFSVPRLMHTLRCVPCAEHPSLRVFYNLLQEGISSITSSHLSDIQWLQDSLPIRDGGLGIRRATSLALSAILASAASTSDLQHDILSSCWSTPDAEFIGACASWSAMYSLPCPADDAAVRQRAWDTPAVARDWLAVWQSASTETDKARLTAIRAQHSSDWLFALPISACDLRLGDEEVSRRLGLNICETHTCPCGANVDMRGLHGLACKCSAGRSTRHQQLNDLIWRALKRADIP